MPQLSTDNIIIGFISVKIENDEFKPYNERVNMGDVSGYRCLEAGNQSWVEYIFGSSRLEMK